MQYLVWQLTVSTQQKFPTLGFADWFSIFDEEDVLLADNFCCDWQRSCIQPHEINSVKLTRPATREQLRRTASRDWRVIYTDSYCNSYTANADGMIVAGSHWCFFEVYQQHSGTAGLPLTLSRGICWLTGMSSTLRSGNSIWGANNLTLAYESTRTLFDSKNRCSWDSWLTRFRRVYPVKQMRRVNRAVVQHASPGFS
jgi:hypothetical protein